MPFIVFYTDIEYPGLHHKLFSVLFHTDKHSQDLIYVINLEDLCVERSKSWKTTELFQAEKTLFTTEVIDMTASLKSVYIFVFMYLRTLWENPVCDLKRHLIYSNRINMKNVCTISKLSLPLCKLNLESANRSKCWKSFFTRASVSSHKCSVDGLWSCSLIKYSDTVVGTVNRVMWPCISEHFLPYCDQLWCCSVWMSIAVSSDDMENGDQYREKYLQA